MIYILENDKLKVKISSMGAELQSIRRNDDNTEYLWQGDAPFWAKRATNIFPNCGRMWEGKYTYEGKTYEMPLHGFVRDMEWEVLRQKSTALTLQVTSTEETLAMYPFPFALEISYTLEGEDLSVAMIVHNTGENTMRFAVGGHPGFRIPLEEGKAFEDYYVEFDAPCQPNRVRMSEKCFYLDAVDPFPLEDNVRLPLRHTLFDQDAIFLRDTSGAVTLRTAGGKRSVHVSYPEMKFVGLWHNPKTEAPFMCIEPWLGLPALDGHVNDLTEHREMTLLEPGETYRNTYVISFN